MGFANDASTTLDFSGVKCRRIRFNITMSRPQNEGKMRIWLGSFLDPVGIGLKLVGLAIAVARPSYSSFALLVLIHILTAVGFVVGFIRSSFRSMRDLHVYMAERGREQWFRSALSNNTEVFDGSSKGPVQHKNKLYLISYDNNVSTDTVCYYNIVGDTYILSANAGEDFSTIPLMQQFVILHELGHATWAGGEVWVRAWPNLIYSLLAVVLAWHVAVGWPWWCDLLSVVGVVFSVGQVLRAARIETAEVFADRYSIKKIAARNIDDALHVANRLVEFWSIVNNTGEDQFRRHLELQERIKGIRRIIYMLQRAKSGLQAVDTDNFPPFIRNFFDYCWAIALSISVYFWIGDVSEIGMITLIIAALVAIAFCYLYRNRRMRQILTIETFILKACCSSRGHFDGS